MATRREPEEEADIAAAGKTINGADLEFHFRPKVENILVEPPFTAIQPEQ